MELDTETGKKVLERSIREHLRVKLRDVPPTVMSEVALELGTQAVVTSLSITAITTYTNAIIETKIPRLHITDKDLKSDFEEFKEQFNNVKKVAETWSSIVVNLGAVPLGLDAINSTVVSLLKTLSILEPGSSDYEKNMDILNNLLSIKQEEMNSLVKQIDDYAKSLTKATNYMLEQVQDGVFKNLSEFYHKEIAQLNEDIKSLQGDIDSLNKKHDWLIVGITGAALTTVIGLVNLWNPVGWLFLGGGITGLYFSISELIKTEVDIVEKRLEIDKNELWKAKDSTALGFISMFSQQVIGYESLNGTACLELNNLREAYKDLATDIKKMISDVKSDQISTASTEWEQILEEAQYLVNLTNYIWPSTNFLSNPTTFSAVDNDIYNVLVSGEIQHYNHSTNKWSKINGTALSCIAAKQKVVAIDGAPITALEMVTKRKSSFKVKVLDTQKNEWTNISEFKARVIATDGDEIYCVKTESQSVYQYTGTDTKWTKLPEIIDNTANGSSMIFGESLIDTPDAVNQLCVINGQVYALTNNSMNVYTYNGEKWEKIIDEKCLSITSNGNWLGYVTLKGKGYNFNTETKKSTENKSDFTAQIGQLTNSAQCIINDKLELKYSDGETLTSLQGKALNVHTSDTDICYYTDTVGNIFRSSDPKKNKWDKLPRI